VSTAILNRSPSDLHGIYATYDSGPVEPVASWKVALVVSASGPTILGAESHACIVGDSHISEKSRREPLWWAPLRNIECDLLAP